MNTGEWETQVSNTIIQKRKNQDATESNTNTHTHTHTHTLRITKQNLDKKKHFTTTTDSQAF